MPGLGRDRNERAWTEHLATNVRARALLEAVRRAHLPEHTAATLDEILAALVAETTSDEFGVGQPRPSHCAIHQLHVAGKFPDVGINDPRDRLTFGFAVGARPVGAGADVFDTVRCAPDRPEGGDVSGAPLSLMT